MFGMRKDVMRRCTERCRCDNTVAESMITYSTICIYLEDSEISGRLRYIAMAQATGTLPHAVMQQIMQVRFCMQGVH